MSEGYSTWTPPLAADPPSLGGLDLPGLIAVQREASSPAVVVQHFSGRSVVLHRLAESAQPLGEVSAYRWSFSVDAESEDLWYLLRRMYRRGSVADWVDYRDEVAEWDTAAGVLTYDLLRPPAAEVVVGFPDADYPHRVLVDGVGLTVVSGAPATGQAQVTATTVVLGDDPGAGAELELRYMARYRVAVVSMPDELAGFHDLSASVELREVRE